MYTALITRNRTDQGYFKVAIFRKSPEPEPDFDIVEIMHGDDPDKLKERCLDFLRDFEG